ncbi:MAG TPA: cupin domain-containing protein [Sphingobacteriaceae bacterium]|nr:cupin domain-containing protein [Sphingobacteriaceae bacterium]
MTQPDWHPFDPETFIWDGIVPREYKFHQGEEVGWGWKDVTRFTLTDYPPGYEGAAFEMRYFEIGPGGYSSLEKHQHVHAILVLRGRGKIIRGGEVLEAKPFDFLFIPGGTPHQFVNAGEEEPFGFICVVDRERDRPQVLSEEELARLQADPKTGPVLRLGPADKGSKPGSGPAAQQG